MRIAYFVVWNEPPGSTTYRGIFAKIQNQIQTWIALGCEVKLFIHCHTTSAVSTAYQDFDRFPVHVSTYRSAIDRLQEGGRLLQAFREWQPDVVYCRHAYFIPFLRDMARAFPTVVEIASDDIAQIVAQSGYGRQYWYFRLSRGLWLKHVRGFVHVIGELPKRPHYTKFKKPAIVVGDSIDLSRVTSLPAPNNPVPNLVFLASTALWHGVDKIVKLAHRFPQWQFHLIGTLPNEIKSQLPGNMTAYGFLARDEYQHIMEKADVAIGSLAMHRIGLSTGAPLKVREYLSHGIPTIIGYQDNDFPTPVPFLLTLPSTEDNVETHFDEICDFVTKSLGKRVPRDQVAHLDTMVKEQIRIDFMCEIMQQGRT